MVPHLVKISVQDDVPFILRRKIQEEEQLNIPVPKSPGDVS
jgi:hypothetical protein